MKSPLHYRLLISAAKRQAGMTLMEIIAALAIIAAVIVGALALFNSAQSSNQSVAMLKDLISLRSATQQLFLGQGTYGANGTNLNATLINSNKVPNDLVTAAPNTITPPWPGGAVIVAATANPSRFTVTFNAVPRDICVQLIANSSTGWFSVAAGGNTQNNFPVNPAQATNMCNAAANNIVWTSSN